MSILKTIVNKIRAVFKKEKVVKKQLTEEELAIHMERVTALHEAAHAITTHLSKFHFLAGDVSIHSANTGETFMALSKSKLLNNGKSLTVAMEDPEVVEDLAIIMYSGFEAEKVYCNKYPEVPLDDSFSKNDYWVVQQAIDNCADSSINKEKLVLKSRGVVIEQWLMIWELSQHLIDSPNKSIDWLFLTDALNASFNSSQHDG